MMAFCSNCGNKLASDVKFCSNCGAPVIERGSNQREQVYEGNLHKCPNCGEVLKSFTSVCPSCGHEFRNVKSSGAVKEFADKLEQIQKYRKPVSTWSSVAKAFGIGRADATDEQITNLIRNFSVPNTKEDVFEFMILASSNIDINALSRWGNANDMNVEEFKVQKAISEAWIVKADQVYQKASLAFGSDSDFSKIHEMYHQKMNEVKKAKKGAKLKPILILSGWILFLVMDFSVIFVMAGRDSRKEAKLEEKLNAIVVEIQTDIRNGDYDDALIKANGLRFDENLDSKKAEQWDVQREYLIDMINKKAREDEQ